MKKYNQNNFIYFSSFSNNYNDRQDIQGTPGVVSAGCTALLCRLQRQITLTFTLVSSNHGTLPLVLTSSNMKYRYDINRLNEQYFCNLVSTLHHCIVDLVLLPF